LQLSRKFIRRSSVAGLRSQTNHGFLRDQSQPAPTMTSRIKRTNMINQKSLSKAPP
jgi:hypothetical protein